jgi:hypothetical protein
MASCNTCKHFNILIEDMHELDLYRNKKIITGICRIEQEKIQSINCCKHYEPDLM